MERSTERGLVVHEGKSSASIAKAEGVMVPRRTLWRRPAGERLDLGPKAFRGGGEAWVGCDQDFGGSTLTRSASRTSSATNRVRIVCIARAELERDLLVEQGGHDEGEHLGLAHGVSS